MQNTRICGSCKKRPTESDICSYCGKCWERAVRIKEKMKDEKCAICNGNDWSSTICQNCYSQALPIPYENEEQRKKDMNFVETDGFFYL